MTEAVNKIRTDEIIDFLQEVVFEGKVVTTESIRAANILLGKTLPNLQSTTLKGNDADGGFTINVKRDF